VHESLTDITIPQLPLSSSERHFLHCNNYRDESSTAEGNTFRPANMVIKRARPNDLCDSDDDSGAFTYSLPLLETTANWPTKRQKTDSASEAAEIAKRGLDPFSIFKCIGGGADLPLHQFLAEWRLHCHARSLCVFE
jgi:hypothetical protein